jgi:hypothetical protein
MCTSRKFPFMFPKEDMRLLSRIRRGGISRKIFASQAISQSYTFPRIPQNSILKSKYGSISKTSISPIEYLRIMKI